MLNYFDHLIVKILADEFKFNRLEYLGENTEKYTTCCWYPSKRNKNNQNISFANKKANKQN